MPIFACPALSLAMPKGALFVSRPQGVLHAAGRKKTKKKNSQAQCGCTFCPQPEDRASIHTRTVHSLAIKRVHFRPQPEHREDAHTRTTHSLGTKMGPCTHCIIPRMEMHTLRTERKDQALTVSTTPEGFFHRRPHHPQSATSRRES